MDENTIIPRDRKAPGPIEIITAPATPIAWEQPQREPHLIDYLRILRKHRWLILTFLLTIVTLVAIATFKMKPVYQATARLEIDRDTPVIAPFQGADSDDLYEDLENYIETQSKILQSDTLALKTIRSTGLADNPAFGGTPNSDTQIPELSANQPPMERPAVLGEFENSLSVKRVPNSRLLDVSFESTDPRLAAKVLNAHLKNYIDSNFTSHLASTNDASHYFEDQLTELKKKVEDSENKRLEYERDNQIWQIDEKQNITTDKLADLNKELTDAQADRIKKQAEYTMAKSGDLDSIPAIRDSVLIQTLTGKQSELRQQLADAENRTGPKFPEVQRLQEQVKQLDTLVANEKKSIVGRIEEEYQASVQRETLLKNSLEQQKKETNDMGEKLVQYNILKRDADSYKQLYDGLQQKLNEAEVSAGLHSSNIHIVDSAMIPTAPERPNKSRNILMAIVVGLIGGIGIAFLREYLDNTVKTPDDIEMMTNLPSLAVVPSFATIEGAKQGRMSKLLSGSGADPGEISVQLMSYCMPQSQVSEAFRSLRTSLLLSQAGHPPQVILVTSALPREGKTTSAVNLAVTLAQLGDRTLLIDGDLRKPSVAKVLCLPDGKYAGLSSYLAGASTLDLVTVLHPVIPNLSVIPTGPIPPNPADLLSAERMRQAVLELRQEYKFIVIDSPPLMAATDAVILSVLVDGVLLVVRSGETPKEAFKRTRDLLSGVKCRLLGVLLNAVDSHAPDYYYSYRYYPYSYGGEGEGSKSRKKAASA
jgi:polysaccharide biosynthesis transport protein